MSIRRLATAATSLAVGEAEQRRAFRRELEEDHLNRSLYWAIIVLLLIWNAFIAVDWLFYRDHFTSLLASRLILNALLIAFATITIRWSRRWTGIAVCVACGAMLLSVIRDAGGTGGRYPPGLMLLFAGMPPLLTLSMGEAIAICSMVSASFLWMTCADSESLEGVEWANVWFVLASSALCVASCKLLDRLRFEHFLKRNALRLMKDEIEHRNRQLKTINAKLLSSRRELEIYARAVSHDLRNPISAAFEALDLVDAHAADETWIRLARANLRQADSLIEELRAVAHSRQARTETTRVHLGDVVAEVLERARNDPRSNRAILTRRGVFCVVRGSRAKLVHALANLVDNALRATSHLATPAIEIEGRGETGVAIIAVMDNGCGMRTEDVERIFEPSVAGIGAEVGDMGMGLALVKEIVESHGGWVTCESSVGNGSRFTVRLPRWRSAMGER